MSYVAEKAVADYIDHLESTISSDLAGLHILVDCANGAASATAARLFDASPSCAPTSSTPTRTGSTSTKSAVPPHGRLGRHGKGGGAMTSVSPLTATQTAAWQWMSGGS